MSRYIDADDLKMDLIGWETEPTDEEIERVIDNMRMIPIIRKESRNDLEKRYIHRRFPA